jgi:hypothetical protein
MLDHHKEGCDYFAYHDMDDCLARSCLEKLTAGFDASEPFIMGSGRHAGVLPLGQKRHLPTRRLECRRTDPQFHHMLGDNQ